MGDFNYSLPCYLKQKRRKDEEEPTKLEIQAPI
jgi:hypothetical protein